MNLSNTATSESPDQIILPSGILFGTATAAYQTEGAAHEGGRGVSIWDTFTAKAGTVSDGSNGDRANDHYHRYEEDLDLLVTLGIPAYRFSIAWPRIQPTGTGPINAEGIAFYRRLIDGLVDRGIAPYATIYHWDLPQALQDEGGWTNRQTAYAFAEYARIVGTEFGDSVAAWGTLNEPWCVAFLGHGKGMHAPGIKDPESALTVAHHLNLAHGLAVQELRKVIPEGRKVSITLNLHALYGVGASGGEAVRRIDALGNRIFLGPILEGSYPDDLREATREITDWSFVQEGDLKQIHQPIDFLGVNYYQANHVEIWNGQEPRHNIDRFSADKGTAWPGAEDVNWV